MKHAKDQTGAHGRTSRAVVASTEPLFDFLCRVPGLKRATVKKLLKFGAVAVNGQPVRQFDHPLSPGDEVAVGDIRTAAAADRLNYSRIQIVFEDDWLLVAEKPAGLLTVASDRDKTDTLYFRLNEYLAGRRGSAPSRAFVVHRLDQETSGLVLFAKNAHVKQLVQDAWPSVTKRYLAVVEGVPQSVQGSVTSYLGEGKSLKVFSSIHETPGSKLATTHYRVLDSRSGLSLLDVRLETGRKHQIRVHLAGLHFPVAGDHRYGAKADPCGRLALHAAQLALSHPATRQPLEFHSPPPKTMRRLFPHSLKEGAVSGRSG